jgi:hypothetical protein
LINPGVSSRCRQGVKSGCRLTPRDLAFARGLRGAVPHLRCPGLLADRGLESRRPPLGARCCAFSRPVSVENYDGA